MAPPSGVNLMALEIKLNNMFFKYAFLNFLYLFAKTWWIGEPICKLFLVYSTLATILWGLSVGSVPLINILKTNLYSKQPFRRNQYCFGYFHPSSLLSLYIDYPYMKNSIGLWITTFGTIIALIWRKENIWIQELYHLKRNKFGRR